MLLFSLDDASFAIQFDNPQPVSALTDALDDCFQIRIVDRNASGIHLEFGRYNVQLWDEDNPIAEFTVDGFKQMPMDTAPAD